MNANNPKTWRFAAKMPEPSTVDIAMAWAWVQDRGTARGLSDSVLTSLWLWIENREISLPPALWIAQECERRWGSAVEDSGTESGASDT